MVTKRSESVASVETLRRPSSARAAAAGAVPVAGSPERRAQGATGGDEGAAADDEANGSDESAGGRAVAPALAKHQQPGEHGNGGKGAVLDGQQAARRQAREARL